MLALFARRTAALPVATRSKLSNAASALMLAGCLAGCAALYDDFLESSDAWHAHRRQARADTLQPASHQALLVPPRKPECEAAAGGRRLAPEGDVNAELAERIKLEYERECYRQAEMRVRRQLRALQTAVREDCEEPSERASEGR